MTVKSNVTLEEIKKSKYIYKIYRNKIGIFHCEQHKLIFFDVDIFFYKVGGSFYGVASDIYSKVFSFKDIKIILNTSDNSFVFSLPFYSLNPFTKEDLLYLTKAQKLDEIQKQITHLEKVKEKAKNALKQKEDELAQIRSELNV